MTKLPEKDLLQGTKKPATTTGEMKNALGKLRDYLSELFGDDSSDKEKARQTLGIDLSALSVKSDIEAALSHKADRTELENKADKNEIDVLEAEIAKRGIPVGSIDYFATPTPPAGYLKADGSAVGRLTYPDLYAVIGTIFGEGDGETTFNLPDLRGEFIRGWDDGKETDAGRMFGSVQSDAIRNITGTFSRGGMGGSDGAFAEGEAFTGVGQNWQTNYKAIFDASLIVPTANENRPRNIALLACIKAFDTSINPGLVDVGALAAEMNGKLDKTANGKAVRFVTDSFREGENWWRKWSDGWIEQGGMNTETVLNRNIVFHIPMLDTSYAILTTVLSVPSGVVVISVNTKSTSGTSMYATYSTNGSSGAAVQHFQWYVCGQGAS